MYVIERSKDKIIVRSGTGTGSAVFMAEPDSLILYRTTAGKEQIQVSKVKDLSDEALLLALASAVEIKDFAHEK